MDRREFLLGLVALPLAPAAIRAGLGGGTPVALVTADTQSRIVAVELSSGRVLDSIPTRSDPRSIESVGSTAVVAHTTEGAVSLIDGSTLRVTGVLEGFDEPRYTAASPSGRYAYVTDSGRGDLAVIDVRRGRILRKAPLGGPARHVSLDRSGRRLWVALGTKAELVAVVDLIDPARPRLVRRFRPPFLAHDVGFAPDGRRVWVTSGDRGTIAVYDARRGRVLFTVPADAPPQHVTFLGGAAHVTSGDDGTLRVHALRDGRVLEAARVPRGSYNVQQGWGRILTPSLSVGTLCVLNARGRLVSRVCVAPSSHDACFVVTA